MCFHFLTPLLVSKCTTYCIICQYCSYMSTSAEVQQEECKTEICWWHFESDFYNFKVRRKKTLKWIKFKRHLCVLCSACVDRESLSVKWVGCLFFFLELLNFFMSSANVLKWKANIHFRACFAACCTSCVPLIQQKSYQGNSTQSSQQADNLSQWTG